MRMEAELKDLFTLSLEEITKKLAHKINNNTALLSAMPKGEKITPRAVAQLIMNGWGGVAMQAIDDKEEIRFWDSFKYKIRKKLLIL